MESSQETAVTEIIRTKLGQAEVHGHIIAGHELVIADEPHALVKDGVSSPMPCGVPYVRNRELARRTEGKVTHLIVGGLYDVDRLMNHIKIGSAMEMREIFEKRSEVRRCADDLLASGSMEPEVVQMVLKILHLLEQDFAEPKRAPRKLVASRRLKQARELRADPDRRKIAPSAMAAYAASHHLDVRIEDLGEIRRFFDRSNFRVFLLLEEHRETIRRLREFVDARPTICGDPLRHAYPGEFSELKLMLADPDKRKNAQTLLQRRLHDFIRRLELMRELPFVALAERTRRTLRMLSAYADEGQVLAMGKLQQQLFQNVMQMRMLDHLESRIIGPLAFYIARTPAKKRQVTDAVRVDVRRRLDVMLKAIHRLPKEAIAGSLQDEIIRKIALGMTADTQGKLRLAERFLKEASRELSVVQL